MRTAGVRRGDAGPPDSPPFQKCRILVDLSLRTAHAIGLLRAKQSPMGGADRVVHGI
jgi:hypothetical protein